jgi:vacuolar-type H+-ATPase subunit I/STV1
MADIDNGRIRTAERLARIEERLETVLSELERLSAALACILDKHGARLDAAEDELIRIGEQRRIIAGIQVAFTIVASAIAAWLGSKK